jgi:Flp pilus assembly secretin CpaC
MKSLVRSTLVTLSLLSVPALAEPSSKLSVEESKETLTLRTGDATALLVPGLMRIAIGDPEIADIRTTGESGIRVDGLKAGETTMLVWTDKGRKAYRIVVLE